MPSKLHHIGGRVKNVIKYLGKILSSKQTGSFDEWHRLEFSKEYPKQPYCHHQFGINYGERK